MPLQEVQAGVFRQHPDYGGRPDETSFPPGFEPKTFADYTEAGFDEAWRDYYDAQRDRHGVVQSQVVATHGTARYLAERVSDGAV